MAARKWLIALVISLAVVYAFAFSYIYAVAYRIPALGRDGRWLVRAGVSMLPRPSLEQMLSAEMAARISRETDPREKEKWTKLRAAARNEIDAAHGEGFLIAILSLNIVWMPMIYRWRRKRERAAREGRVERVVN